jgi:ATP-grasp domain
VVTRARAQVAPRLALAADDERTATEVAQVAGERGVPVERLGLEAAIGAPVGAIAFAPAAPLDAARAAALAPLVAAAAESRRPVVLLTGHERVRGRAAEERAIAIAHLRAHGAIPIDDPDAWFETAVFMAVHGPPAGARVAIIAPPGGWLALAAAGLASEDEQRGGRLSVHDPEPDAAPLPADVVLVDGRLDAPTPERAGRALVVPVVARAELLVPDGRTALVGLRAALAATRALARHAERMAAGLGAAPTSDAKRLRPDRTRADKALTSAHGGRLGDHESKLLLAAYGAPVTRQAVATTPSAAVRYAQQLGWPVELKAWDPALLTERAGGAVVGNVRNPPDVRRAFGAVATAASLNVGVPVIVRQTPAPGRELTARFEPHSGLGWTVLVEVAGAGSRPLAAPAPLRAADADDIVSVLEANRAGDAPPDRDALADLLIRASFAAVHSDTIASLELARVIVGNKGEGAIIVDARVELRRKR